MVDTPAYNAGIMAGDAILKIDGKSTDGMRLTDAVALIQGEPGTKVTLTVRSEDGKTRDVPLERARIQVRSVLGDRRKGDGKSWDFMWDHQEKIGYLRLTGFGKNTVSEMKEALEELRKQGMRGLVLDLRSNPGGLLKSAKEVSNLFLEKGLIVSIKGDNQDEEAYHADRHEAVLGKDSGVPMAVLINRYSASASEIVAACLQDHHRAIVVGERSYGKGSVQNVIPLTRGQGALKLTTAYYWRPSGKMVHREKDARDSDDWGVIPDIVVSLSREERMAYNRARNERDILRDHKDPKKVPPFEDKVLNRAVEVLKEKLRKKE
jgi:carboxyl-terminal processing protease